MLKIKIIVEFLKIILFITYKINSQISNIKTFYTTMNEYANGHIFYLDRHYINCNQISGKNNAISSLKYFLANNQFNFEYNCLSSGSIGNNFQNFNTVYHSVDPINYLITNDLCSAIADLNRHEIICPDKTVLKSFILKRNPASNMEIHYEYSCLPAILGDCTDTSTVLTNLVDGKTSEWLKHEINLDSNSAFQKIKINYSGSNLKQINLQYRYCIVNQCHDSCFTCETKNDFCIICSSDYFIIEGIPNKCYNKNIPLEGYYFNLSISKFSQCDISCKYCENTKTFCKICNIGYFPIFNNINDCRNSANIGYYLDSTDINNKIYNLCDISCKTCVDLAANCTACANNYFPLVNNSTRCYSNPPEGYFLFNNIYNKCDISCKTCVDLAEKCTACANNYFPLVNNSTRCYSNPPEGYFLFNNIYNKCDISCKTCVDLAEKCTACANNYFPLVNNSTRCYSNPPEGYFLFNNIYNKCDISCKTCYSKSNDCIECEENFFFSELNNKSCIRSDTSNYYLDNNLMKKCDDSCEICKDQAFYCLKCNYKNNYFPVENYKGKCVNSDKNLIGYYFNKEEKIFYTCSDECFQCSLNKFNCLICNLNNNFFPITTNSTNSKYLENPKKLCYFNCPDHFYKNITLKECSDCDISCSTCKINATNCETCAEGYYPLSDNKNSCKNSKPDNSYVFDNNQWFKCPFPCVICNENKTCKSCLMNYYLQEDTGTCLLNCPQGYYIKNANHTNKICRRFTETFIFALNTSICNFFIILCFFLLIL